MFAVKCLLLAMAAVAANAFSLGPLDILYHLYTRNNPTLSEPLLPTTSSIMSSSHFSPLRYTFFIIHSFNDTAGGNANAFLIPALLSNSDVNVIAVDWSRGANMYSNALGHAPQVGRAIAEFINILQGYFSYFPTHIRIVGVGMGGHIAGIAARNIENFANVKIPKIVAIDPSLFGWTHHPEILNANDADVVEVLHTTAGLLGYDRPLGTIDFYSNGGQAQTGCGNDVQCSHTYAYVYYAESITPGSGIFLGVKCEDYVQAMAQQCVSDITVAFGGDDDKTGVRGVFSFRTNAVPPFAMN